MNKSVKKILLISLVIGFCILVTINLDNPKLGIITVTTPLPPSQLEIDLGEMVDQYKKGEVSEIDISLLTTFTWDRLYVFGAYTDLSKLDSMFGNSWFGYSWRDNCYTDIEYSDGVALLVFASENKVVNCIDYPLVGRNDITDYDVHDFSGLQKYESGFLPEEARFILDERGRAIWVGDK
jgi:hypothetical protein